MNKNKIDLKQIDPDQYEIILDHNIIYVTRQINPGTKDIYIYFVDIWGIDPNSELIENDNYDCIDLTMEYLNHNYDIPITITNKIKKGLK